MKDLDEYIRHGEPEKREKAYIWQTAIGLQAVDGLPLPTISMKLPKDILRGGA